MDHIKERLKLIYPGREEEIYKEILSLCAKWKNTEFPSYNKVNNEDVMLITYGDGVKAAGEPPLKTLKRFVDDNLKGYISAIHLLPMFPYTSDDGFSVSDFREINSELGGWDEIEELKQGYDLMFDGVINHVSKSSEYFKNFLACLPPYDNFFITAEKDKDYSMVTRPRALPLLTEFETKKGKKHVWTTFSEDQIDFNYKEPAVLLEILDILLMYAAKGARFLRFDAIGFMWKEDDSTCMHLPQTHELVKLMREVLENSAKGCTIITETNVPHKDNISYFGNGHDEAGMVYQFPLPPLTLYSFLSGSAEKLTEWADSLEPTTEDTTYFNFLSSHDGIGMRPVEDILTENEKQFVANEVLKRGGQISYRTMPDGSQSPYELNINFMDAIVGDESVASTGIEKYMASQCILLSVMGMPGIYYHSLIGSKNCYEDYEKSGIKRRINREKLNYDILKEELMDEKSLRNKVLTKYKQLIKTRREHTEFSPNSPQKVLRLDERVFALIRGNQKKRMLVLINVSREPVYLETSYSGVEVIKNIKVQGKINMAPYEYLWIKLD